MSVTSTTPVAPVCGHPALPSCQGTLTPAIPEVFFHLRSLCVITRRLRQATARASQRGWFTGHITQKKLSSGGCLRRGLRVAAWLSDPTSTGIPGPKQRGARKDQEHQARSLTTGRQAALQEGTVCRAWGQVSYTRVLPCANRNAAKPSPMTACRNHGRAFLLPASNWRPSSESSPASRLGGKHHGAPTRRRCGARVRLKQNAFACGTSAAESFTE